LGSDIIQQKNGGGGEREARNHLDEGKHTSRLQRRRENQKSNTKFHPITLRDKFVLNLREEIWETAIRAKDLRGKTAIHYFSVKKSEKRPPGMAKKEGKTKLSIGVKEGSIREASWDKKEARGGGGVRTGS